MLWIALVLISYRIEPPIAATASRLQLPSRTHLLGTGPAGQDLLALISIATLRSQGYAILATAIAVIPALLVGLASALNHQGVIDRVQSLGTSLVEAISPLLFLAAVLAVYPHSPNWLMALFLGIFSSTQLIGVVRDAVTDELRSLRYEAAVSIGSTMFWRVRHYLFPAVMSRCVPQFMALTAVNLGALGAIGFLGIGVEHDMSLGYLIFDALGHLSEARHYFAAVTASFLGCVFLAGWLGQSFELSLSSREHEGTDA